MTQQSDNARRIREVDYGVYREPVRSPCRVCGYEMDSASETPGNTRGKPEADDFGLCLRCGALSVYTGIGLTQREPTAEEAAEFAASPDASVQRHIRRANPLHWRESRGERP
jgi:hypothetical protein